jgi:hypothetical protein
MQRHNQLRQTNPLNQKSEFRNLRSGSILDVGFLKQVMLPHFILLHLKGKHLLDLTIGGYPATGRILKTISLRWIPNGKILDICTKTNVISTTSTPETRRKTVRIMCSSVKKIIDTTSLCF